MKNDSRNPKFKRKLNVELESLGKATCITLNFCPDRPGKNQMYESFRVTSIEQLGVAEFSGE